MLRCLVIAALSILASSSASAQTVRLDQYQHPSEPRFKVFNQVYLKGVVDGLTLHRSGLRAVQQSPSPESGLWLDQSHFCRLRTTRSSLIATDNCPAAILRWANRHVGTATFIDAGGCAGAAARSSAIYRAIRRIVCATMGSGSASSEREPAVSGARIEEGSR